MIFCGLQSLSSTHQKHTVNKVHPLMRRLLDHNESARCGKSNVTTQSDGDWPTSDVDFKTLLYAHAHTKNMHTLGNTHTYHPKTTLMNKRTRRKSLFCKLN